MFWIPIALERGLSESDTVIVGIGIDLAEVPRFARMLERWGERFARKVFTDGERSFAVSRAHPEMHYAARFAAKEAMLKALSVPRGLRWHEMEVVGGGTEPPRLRLSGKAKQEADRRGIVSVHLSLSHTADVASAVVIAESV